MDPLMKDDLRENRLHEPVIDERRSGMMPMIVGGLLVAVGLLAFLFYDNGANRDVETTATTKPPITQPAAPTPVPAQPTPGAPSPTPAPSPTGTANPQQ